MKRWHGRGHWQIRLASHGLCVVLRIAGRHDGRPCSDCCVGGDGDKGDEGGGEEEKAGGEEHGAEMCTLTC